jgi:hypothetical protein
MSLKGVAAMAIATDAPRKANRKRLFGRVIFQVTTVEEGFKMMGRTVQHFAAGARRPEQCTTAHPAFSAFVREGKQFSRAALRDLRPQRKMRKRGNALLLGSGLDPATQKHVIERVAMTVKGFYGDTIRNHQCVITPQTPSRWLRDSCLGVRWEY